MCVGTYVCVYVHVTIEIVDITYTADSVCYPTPFLRCMILTAA